SVGFNGLNLPEHGEAFRESSYTFHFSDGNASLARLLVNRLIPSAFPAANLTMDTIVQARPDYARLDAAGSSMRVRLSSTAVRVQHDGGPQRAPAVRVAYLHDGKLKAVRAANVVLACNNALIPALMPELPEAQ